MVQVGWVASRSCVYWMYVSLADASLDNKVYNKVLWLVSGKW